MREARLNLQANYKEKCERQILDIIRTYKKEEIFEIRVSKIKEGIKAEILTNLPLHFDDIILELIDREELDADFKNGVLYLDKTRSVLEK